MCMDHICVCVKLIKCERTNTQRAPVVNLDVKESETPAGESHLFTAEPVTLCVRVCVHVSLSVSECECVCVWGAKTQK